MKLDRLVDSRKSRIYFVKKLLSLYTAYKKADKDPVLRVIFTNGKSK